MAQRFFLLRGATEPGVCFDQFDYAIQAVYNSASPKWKSQVLDELTKAYNGS